MTIFDLLFAYGLCFGAMNKLDFLYGRSAFTDALLKCSYCTGFHAGWLAWVLTMPSRGVPQTLTLAVASQPVAWAFSSAVVCYGADTVLQLAESWIRKEEDNG